MEPQDEPDWQALWERIVADAERHVEEWERQARWLEEASTHLVSPDEWYAAQRRASKAFVRHWLQQVDLAHAINTDDISWYIERWHPATPPANGPRIAYSKYESSISLTFYTEISYDEYEIFVSSIYDRAPDTVNPPAIWRKHAARKRAKRQRQAGTPSRYKLSTWQAGQHPMGSRPSLRDWARRVCRRH